MPSDGILGRDFLKKCQCQIEYKNETLTVRPNGMPEAVISLNHSAGKMAIPPRSEIYKMVQINSDEFPCYIEAQEIKHNVFVPNSIVYEKQAYIRILNTNDKIAVFDQNEDHLRIQSLQEYEVVTPNENKRGKSNGRIDELISIIQNNCPSHAHAKFLPLCEEFDDVFYLENDTLTVNNFYQQKLNLKDNEPVYTRNYRLPYAHKEEIARQVEKLSRDQLIEASESNFNSPWETKI